MRITSLGYHNPAAPPSEAVSIVTKPFPDGSLTIVARGEKKVLAAGVTNTLWEIGDIVALVEAEEIKKDRKRGPGADQ